MKILVITRNAWDDSNAAGNTLSNFFRGLEDAEFANIYFRNSEPHNKICSRYYQTSESDVIRNWFSPARIGGQKTVLPSESSDTEAKDSSREKTAIRFIQRNGIKAAYKLSDYVWYREKWINQRLRAFIEDFSPDAVFSFVKAAPQYYLTVRFLREQFKLPLISWIADDEYSGFLKAGLKREIDNLAYILRESSAVFGCSEELCKYYNDIFGCKAEPLYKSCESFEPLRAEVNDPIKLVYAGNMLYGRADTLSKLADACDECVLNGMKAILEIYSNTPLSPDEIRHCFGNSSCAEYMGKADYETVKQKLYRADIVLHVESFEPEQILKTKYSFSTKIIDYLQSGSLLLAVGPSDTASIRYIRDIPGTCVIDDRDSICARLKELLSDTGSFYRRKIAIRSFSEQNHNASVSEQKLTEAFLDIAQRRNRSDFS